MTLPEAAAVFRVQGTSEGTCWVDGDGNEVDTNVEAIDDPNAGTVQTLVANVTDQVIQQADETDLLSFICQTDRPIDGICQEIMNHFCTKHMKFLFIRLSK